MRVLLNETDAFRVPESVITTEVGDTIIVLDLDTGTYFSMSGTAADIWRGAAEGSCAEEIARSLVETYEVDLPKAAADVRDFLKSASTHGLLIAT